MRHRKSKITLDRNSAPRRVLLRHLANAFIHQERIVTTAAKVRATRSSVERLISRGKTSTLQNRRELIRVLADADSATKILEKLGPRFQSRPGGYVRLTKISTRIGDRAEQVVMEFLP